MQLASAWVKDIESRPGGEKLSAVAQEAVAGATAESAHVQTVAALVRLQGDVAGLLEFVEMPKELVRSGETRL